MRGVKTKTGGRWKRAVVFLVLTGIFGILAHSVKNVYLKKKGAEDAFVKMREEKIALENRKQFLEQSINRLSTPEGVDFEIRRKLNVASAGESVAIIVSQEESIDTASTKPSAWEQLKSFFAQLFK